MLVGEGKHGPTSACGVTENVWMTKGDVRLHSKSPRTRGLAGELGVLREVLKGTVPLQSRETLTPFSY